MYYKIYFYFSFIFIFVSCSHLSPARKTSSDFSGYEDFLFGYELTFTYKNLSSSKDDKDKEGVEKVEINKKLSDELDNIRNHYVEHFSETRMITVSKLKWNKKERKNFFLIDVGKGISPINRGLTFLIFVDLFTYEVTFNPVTLEELSDLKDFLEDNIFDFFKKQNLYPHKHIGGGDINLDISLNFHNSYAYFRNFVIDMVNNDFLNMGIFRPTNAFILPINMRSIIFGEKFKSTLLSFRDRAKRLDEKYRKNISNLKARDSVEVFIPFFSSRNSPYRIRKGKKLNNRFEWRVPPPQKNVDDMIYFSEFLAKRIVYIKEKYDQDGELIQLKNDFPDNLSAEELIDEFKKYILEMEQNPDWERHYQYLDEKLKEKAKNYRD